MLAGIGVFLKRSLKSLGFILLLVFLATSVELHADEDLEPGSEAHCSVTCCPSHHLAPQVSPAHVTEIPRRAQALERDDRRDPSTPAPHAIFHPPKILTA